MTTPNSENGPAGAVRPQKPPHTEDLAAVLAAAFAMLADGVDNRKAAANRPALATVGTDGTPQVRTVVLRAFDPETRTLQVHADRRSAKIPELNANPHATLHVYDAAKDVQLRLSCRATVHCSGPVHDRAWAAKHPASRAYYTLTATPGDPIRSPDEGEFASGQGDRGKENFAVLEIEILRLEWLYIGEEGHRRARFRWTETTVQSDWLVP